MLIMCADGMITTGSPPMVGSLELGGIMLFLLCICSLLRGKSLLLMPNGVKMNLSNVKLTFNCAVYCLLLQCLLPI